MGKLYIKPYFYICPYVHGLLTGYLIETGTWCKFRSKYSSVLISVKNFIKIIFISLTAILVLQNIIFNLLPIVSAIETSLAPSLMSIHLCMVILDDSFNKMTRGFLTLNIWTTIRPMLRVSYLFHPIVFQLIKFFIPSFIVSITIASMIHMFLTIVLNFVVCFVIEKNIERPIIFYLINLFNN